jgi:hypothetical protein
MVAIKLTNESKCIITTFVEQHKPALVSPDKQHPIRSNREVGEKVKNTCSVSTGLALAHQMHTVSFVSALVSHPTLKCHRTAFMGKKMHHQLG